MRAILIVWTGKNDMNLALVYPHTVKMLHVTESYDRLQGLTLLVLIQV